MGIARLGPPEPQPPRAPGPLALSEPDYIDEILSAAVRARPDRADRDLAARRPERARGSRAGGQVGLLARLLREREADEATRADLIGELTGRLAPYLTADGVRLPATIHLVTATAPG